MNFCYSLLEKICLPANQMTNYYGQYTLVLLLLSYLYTNYEQCRVFILLFTESAGAPEN